MAIGSSTSTMYVLFLATNLISALSEFGGLVECCERKSSRMSVSASRCNESYFARKAQLSVVWIRCRQKPTVACVRLIHVSPVT
uniref:Putative secreted protein n=1 Tax=Anopheles darlingi TaxID=43151 RepID=A0A2M4D6X3_ANODA